MKLNRLGDAKREESSFRHGEDTRLDAVVREQGAGDSLGQQSQISLEGDDGALPIRQWAVPGNVLVVRRLGESQ